MGLFQSKSKSRDTLKDSRSKLQDLLATAEVEFSGKLMEIPVSYEWTSILEGVGYKYLEFLYPHDQHVFLIQAKKGFKIPPNKTKYRRTMQVIEGSYQDTTAFTVYKVGDTQEIPAKVVCGQRFLEDTILIVKTDESSINKAR